MLGLIGTNGFVRSRHWEVDSLADLSGKAQAKSWTVRKPSGMARHSHQVQRLGALEFLHEALGRQSEASHQAPVRGQHPEVHQGIGEGHYKAERLETK